MGSDVRYRIWSRGWQAWLCCGGDHTTLLHEAAIFTAEEAEALASGTDDYQLYPVGRDDPPDDMKEDAVPETVHHPSHYGGDTTYEAIKIIEAHNMGFHEGNAVKYIIRAGLKSKDTELEDLRKAAWYLNRRIKQLDLGVDVVPVGTE